MKCALFGVNISARTVISTNDRMVEPSHVIPLDVLIKLESYLSDHFVLFVRQRIFPIKLAILQTKSVDSTIKLSTHFSYFNFYY